MYPSKHIMYGALFSVMLHLLYFPSFGFLAVTIIFLSSVLIDVDHYLVYVWREGSLDLKRAYHYFADGKYKKGHKHTRGPLMIFHTVEFVALLYFLSFYNKNFLYIIIGILFHWCLDIYYMYTHHAISERTYSLIHHLATSKN